MLHLRRVCYLLPKTQPGRHRILNCLVKGSEGLVNLTYIHGHQMRGNYGWRMIFYLICIKNWDSYRRSIRANVILWYMLNPLLVTNLQRPGTSSNGGSNSS